MKLAGRPWARKLRRVAAAAALVVIALWLAWHSPLRDRLIDADRFAHPHDTIVVVDRHGAPLRHVRADGIDRRWVSLDDVSPHLIAAFIAVEDHRYWEHEGVDSRSVARALLTNLVPGRRVSGASTITQQVVKMVYRRPAGLLSKAAEVLRAMVLEERLSKRQILEQYVNRVPFGDRIHGVARASELYFGRPVSDLSVAQAALLAGIPQAPSATEPRRHLAHAIRRRNIVLRRMLATGAIDQNTYELALREPVRISDAPVRPYEAARFVDRRLDDWKQGRASVTRGVLSTSLDLSLQRMSEEVVRQSVATHRMRGVRNGAALVVANDSGAVLAYVAAALESPEEPGGQLDLLRAPRQPGSTLKPFVYALLFERGGNPATIVDDIATPMTGAFGARFVAHDFDGRERGPVRAREALASSLNLAALDVARRVGADAVTTRLRLLSFDRVIDARHHGAAIVLGGVDVTAEQLAFAYLTLARGGRTPPPPWGHDRRIQTEEASMMVADVLRDGTARADAFGRDLESTAGGTFALKTGTSTGWRDAWAAAFDEHHTVVVWLGDPSGRALAGVSGFEAAAPAAALLLRQARERAPVNEIQPTSRPEARWTSVEVCAATGALASANCPHRIQEHFPPGKSPRHRCRAHASDGSLRLAPRFASWVDRTRPSGVRWETSDVSEAEPTVVHPRDGETLLGSAGAEVPLRATVHGVTLDDVVWEVDGRVVSGAWWKPAAGEHEIVAKWRGKRSRGVRVRVTQNTPAIARVRPH